MYERFTDRARKVMQLADQEAQRFNHEYIGTEHVLLGLIKEGSGGAASVLKNLDVDLRNIRLEVEKRVQSGPAVITLAKLPETPGAKRVIEYSMEEARNLNHNYVGTEHILLGLLREQEGVAAQVLRSLGLRLEEVNLGLKLEEVHEEAVKLQATLETESTFVKGTPGARRTLSMIDAAVEEGWQSYKDHMLSITFSDGREGLQGLYVQHGDDWVEIQIWPFPKDDAAETVFLATKDISSLRVRKNPYG
jgi:ATP-dependent Clp protease ATP-binding subunit ClpA